MRRKRGFTLQRVRVQCKTRQAFVAEIDVGCGHPSIVWVELGWDHPWVRLAEEKLARVHLWCIAHSQCLCKR